jgi:hypothetical protein
MQKGLHCAVIGSLAKKNTKLKLIILLPRNLDPEQRKSIKADFRHKMSFLGLYLMGRVKNTDNPRISIPPSISFSFRIDYNTVTFTYGNELKIGEELVGGTLMTNRLLEYAKAYCFEKGFPLELSGQGIQTIRYENSGAARAVWEPVLQDVITLRL